MKFVARRDLSSLHLAEQALSVPMKRFDRPMLRFLTREQIRAVIDVPPDTWLGRRDRLMLTLLYNTGARVSEVIGVRVGHAILGEAPCVHLHGKGRKQRSVPLWKETARELKEWLRLNGVEKVSAADAYLPWTSSADAHNQWVSTFPQELPVFAARLASKTPSS